MGSDVQAPRELFTQRMAQLHAAAGRPPLKSIISRAGRGGATTVSVSTLSAWLLGHNVPSRFPELRPVLFVLIGHAKQRGLANSQLLDPALLDIVSWERLHAAASRAEPRAAPEPAREPETGCPYLGLAAYQESDHGRFFGRDAVTATVVQRLEGAVNSGGITALVGVSGAGKSSLLRAGVITAVRSGQLSTHGVPTVPVVLMTPGEDPLTELTSRFPYLSRAVDAVRTSQTRRCLDPDYDTDTAGGDGVRDIVRSLTDPIRDAVRDHAPGEPSGEAERPLLIVDQAEELFTLCDDEDARLTFIAALQAMSSSTGDGRGPAVLVLLALRADFYNRFLGYPELREALETRQVTLGPMSRPELRDAIIKPAEGAHLRLETNLVSLLLRDLGVRVGRGLRGPAYDAGMLPLLSHALMATWQHRSRRDGRLTAEGYNAGGGIRGAVAATGERAWGQLDDAQQGAAIEVLLRLTRIGQDTQDTRRRLSKAQLLAQTTDPTAAEKALDVLTDARLVTQDADSVQITHEALLHEWPRLKDSIDTDRAGHLLRQRIEDAAIDWAETNRSPDKLFRGSILAEAHNWAEKQAHQNQLSTTAVAFLHESGRRRRRGVWSRRALIAGVAVLALLAGVAAVIARNQRDDAIYTNVVTRADQVMATDPTLSAQLDLVAHQMRPSDREVIGRILSTQNIPLSRTLPATAGAIYDTAYSPDGRVLATASDGRRVQLWDLANPTRPAPMGAPLHATDAGWVSSTEFSPDGRTLASAGEDGLVRLWDVTDPHHPAPLGSPLDGHNGSISLLAFSPNGRMLACANDDHTIRLWNVTDPAHPSPLGAPLIGHTAIVRSVAFSPDSRTLVSGGDDERLLLWDLTTPEHPVQVGTPMLGHSGLVQSVAFSPDGRTVASGSADTTAQLWNVADRARPVPLGGRLSGHTGRVWSVAFSPDGRLLATGSSDGSARLWNITNPTNIRLRASLPAAAGGFNAVAFSPDGHTLAGGGEDGSTLLWSLPTTVLADSMVRAFGTAFRPDGRLLATGVSDTAPILWDTSDLSHPRPLDPTRIGRTFYRPTKLAFRPDGRVLASDLGGGEPTRLWDVSDPAHPTQIGAPLEQHSEYGCVIAFSPDGRVLVTVDTDRKARLWDVRDPARPVPLGRDLTGHQSYLSWADFSPDGHLLATSSGEKTILWDVRDPAHATAVDAPILHPQAGQISETAFSPDGHLLAIPGENGEVRIWDISDPAHPVLTSSLSAHTKLVSTVAFSPDGHTLAAGGTDRTAQLWDLTDPFHPTPTAVTLTGHTGTVNFVGFSPDGQVLDTSSDDGTVMLWGLNVAAAIDRVCTTRGRLAPTQWDQYLPQLAYNPPC